MAPKLIYRHIYLPSFASLRVRFAAQFLSHTVAAGLSTLVESTSCLRKQRRQPPLQKISTSFSMLLTALLGKPFKECGMASWQLPATKNFCYTFSHGWQVCSPIQTGNYHTWMAGSWTYTHCCPCERTFTPTMVRVVSSPNAWIRTALKTCFQRGKGGNKDNPNAKDFREALRAAVVEAILLQSDSSKNVICSYYTEVAFINAFMSCAISLCFCFEKIVCPFITLVMG